MKEREREKVRRAFSFVQFTSQQNPDSQNNSKTGPTELKHSVSGRHGFLAGAVEHVSAAERAAASAAAASGAAPPASAAVPADGRALVEACDQVLQREVPGIKNNRELISMFQAVNYYWAEIAADKFKGRTFASVAETLAQRDGELGVLDTPEKFKPLCTGAKKLEGFAAGTFRRAKEWMEAGLPAELEAYKK